MPAEPIVNVYPTPDALAAAAADLIVDAAARAVRERGRFLFVLAGGSTPEKTYALLAQPERSARVDWSKVWAFVGDDRLVPYDDKASNFGMARRTLLSKVPLPAEQTFPIDTSLGTADAAAAAYERTLAAALGAAYPGPAPVFDLVLLGLGDDGHTLSLFPGHPSLAETDRWLVGSPPGTLPPPVDRVTFTFKTANAARAAVFTVAGKGKAVPAAAVIAGGASVRTHPAAGICPTHGTLTFLLDEAAASELPPRR